jgi:hypothetical protein
VTPDPRGEVYEDQSGFRSIRIYPSYPALPRYRYPVICIRDMSDNSTIDEVTLQYWIDLQDDALELSDHMIVRSIFL